MNAKEEKKGAKGEEKNTERHEKHRAKDEKDKPSEDWDITNVKAVATMMSRRLFAYVRGRGEKLYSRCRPSDISANAEVISALRAG